jgi:uncharacterized protein YebE (UPF0316 family)
MLELTDWLIPLLIFVARIFDVSIGTVRMIMVISGHRMASAALGFVEVLIWVLAVGGAVEHLSNPIAVLAFAGGFAAGTLVGMTIENRLAIGFRVVRVINPKPGLDLAGALREQGYTATRLDGHDRDGSGRDRVRHDPPEGRPRAARPHRRGDAERVPLCGASRARLGLCSAGGQPGGSISVGAIRSAEKVTATHPDTGHRPTMPPALGTERTGDRDARARHQRRRPRRSSRRWATRSAGSAQEWFRRSGLGVTPDGDPLMAI